jgi:hypothetical protein
LRDGDSFGRVEGEKKAEAMKEVGNAGKFDAAISSECPIKSVRPALLVPVELDDPL